MTTRLTDEEIRDALVLCEQATSGPWVSGKMFALRAVNLSRETKGRSIKTGMCVACVPGYHWDTKPIREFGEKTKFHIHQGEAEEGYHVISSESECTRVAGNYDDEDGGILMQADAEFIVLARDLLPRALAEVANMREGAKQAEDLLRDVAALLCCTELSFRSDGLAHNAYLLGKRVEGFLRGGV